MTLESTEYKIYYVQIPHIIYYQERGKTVMLVASYPDLPLFLSFYAKNVEKHEKAFV